MNRMTARAFLVLTAMLAPGCSDIYRPSYDYASVTVLATDQGGQGVPGARLTLYTGAAHLGYGVTDRDGKYTFAHVPAGGYGVEAGPPEGYVWPDGAVSHRYVSVSRGDTGEVEFEFRAVE